MKEKIQALIFVLIVLALVFLMFGLSAYLMHVAYYQKEIPNETHTSNINHSSPLRMSNFSRDSLSSSRTTS